MCVEFILTNPVLQVNEQALANTPVTPFGSSGAIQGYSKDSWAILNYTWLGVPPALTNWFILNPATGSVTIGAAARLDFLVAKSYNLTVQVTYLQLLLNDTAAVTIWVNEINKPAVWAGLYNASSNASMSTVVITEATPTLTVIGRVLFTDPNTRFPWNVRTYSLQLGAYGSEFFAIDPVSGLLSVSARGALMSWYAQSALWGGKKGTS